jgi:hypothetical protein
LKIPLELSLDVCIYLLDMLSLVEDVCSFLFDVDFPLFSGDPSKNLINPLEYVFFG